MRNQACSIKAPFWRDLPFWLAFTLGPVSWLALLGLGAPTRSVPPAVYSVLLLVVIYPILEEFVFRGGVQRYLYEKPSLRQSLLGLSLANVITSMLFAAMHLINQPPLWAALVFFPSLVFGWARDRYDHIVASIVLHGFYNAGFIYLFSA